MTTQQVAAPSRWRYVFGEAGRNGLAVWTVVAALVVVLVVERGGVFLSADNVTNVLLQSIPLGLVALGQTYVVLTGGIDLSVGSLATLSAVLTAGLINAYPIRVVPVLVVVLVVGVVVGAVHGLLIVRGGVAPFIVTLSSFFLLQGLAFAYTTVPAGAIPSVLADAVYLRIGPIPVAFLALVVIGCALAWVLGCTRFGRHVYAVGGDPDVARSTGIAVGRTTTACYVVCSLLAALAGYFLAAQATIGTPSAGAGLELAAITATVLGGASLLGGRGRLVGTAGGIALLTLVDNALTLMSISSFYQDLLRGAVIVAAVVVFTQKD